MTNLASSSLLLVAAMVTMQPHLVLSSPRNIVSNSELNSTNTQSQADSLEKEELVQVPHQSRKDQHDELEEDEARPKKSEAKLLHHPACEEDIEAALISRKCEPLDYYKKSDFALIACLTNIVPSEDAEDEGKSGLSEKCEHVLWSYKVNVTNDQTLLKEIAKACPDEVQQFTECTALAQRKLKKNPDLTGIGQILSCVIELKDDDNVDLSDSCLLRLTQIEALVFSDYRLVGDFVQSCHNDIQRLGCGRLSDQKSSHSQSNVIECLEKEIKSVGKRCHKQILKVAEYQGEDYHLDRSLFLACKKDRNHLCKDVKAGEGRVYDCLIKNKMSQEMSKKCRKQISRRQKLISEDYKISKGLYQHCKKEIDLNKCGNLTAEEENNKDPISLSTVLLCLESAMYDDKAEFSSLCRIEMGEHRKMLMEDFSISPEIATSCKTDINKYCQPDTDTIHCLMKAASDHNRLERTCEDALTLLLKEVDISEDWRMDPILQRSCQEVVATSCDNAAGPDNVLSCLFTLAAQNSRHMTQACQDTLLEIQYFLVRDFKLNSKLYKKCHRDAERLCNANENWKYDPNRTSSKLIFPCLVKHLYSDDEEDPSNELSDECAELVELSLEQRSISFELHPEIEESCRPDLIQYCPGRTGVGEELVCLQENFDSLDSGCKEAIIVYSRIESRNTFLNTAVASACGEIIQRDCSREIGVRDEGEVMRCLIEKKTNNDRQMTEKCMVAVEHWQIFTLNDWTFSPQFKKLCHRDVMSFCQSSTQSKADVLVCLTQIIQEDYLNDKKQRISHQCRAELKFELLQEHSDIKLDRQLARACSKELSTLCADDQSLECLRNLDHQSLSLKCRPMVFKEEQQEVLLNDVDPLIMKNCPNEINSHCKDTHVEPNSILRCLEEHMDDLNFNNRCKRTVIRRLVQEMSDYRLHPRLQRSCSQDLQKFCTHVIRDAINSEKDFMEGKVIQCLRNVFIENSKEMTKTCKREVENLIRQSAIDIRANRRLTELCPKSIEHCRKSLNINDEEMGDEGKVEECLKELYHNKTIGRFRDPPECVVEIGHVIEASSLNIKVDHVLYEACSVDLAKFCREVEPGSGRQITCLRNVAENKNLQLENRCQKVLLRRLDLYSMALREFPVRGLSDIYQQVYNSPERHMILATAFLLLGLIFVGGLFCGRVTKRAREMKNK